MIFNGCNSRQEFVIERITFLSSDGVSASSGSKTGLISLFQKNYLWISFMWCFSHSLELAIKDALKEFLEPLYLHSKTSKKYSKLNSLYKDLKDQSEMW